MKVSHLPVAGLRNHLVISAWQTPGSDVSEHPGFPATGWAVLAVVDMEAVDVLVDGDGVVEVLLGGVCLIVVMVVVRVLLLVVVVVLLEGGTCIIWSMAGLSTGAPTKTFAVDRV